jgi:hypothetical protein
MKVSLYMNNGITATYYDVRKVYAQERKVTLDLGDDYSCDNSDIFKHNVSAKPYVHCYYDIDMFEIE